MKGIIRAVDRFCYRHPRFGIPNLMIFIIIGNAAVYLVSMLDARFLQFLIFNAEDILHGQIWRLVSFALVPQSDNLLFVAISLYFYYFVGTTLERNWGNGKFTIYYLSGMLFLVVYGFAIYFGMNIIIPLTSLYLNLGMFFVFATFFPDMQVLFMFFIPVKMKWLAILDLVFFAIEIIRLRAYFPANLLPVVCLLHYFVFCGGWLIDYIRPSSIRRKARTVSFRREADRLRREQESRPYKRKCAVCGKTDADNPGLEFRYCSRCEGYHCFCEEHINNHVHFR